MSTEPIDEAVVLLCGFDVGYFDYDDIVKWADHQIVTTEKPADELLDLSMIQIRKTHPTDVQNLLCNLSPTESSMRIEIKLGLIGLLLAKQRITTREVMSRFWSLKDEPGITDEQESQIYFLDDGYDLARAGTYGTIENVEQELHDFVMPYAQQIRERFPQLLGV